MRRRYRVKSLMLTKTGKGLMVNTKGGSFVLPLKEEFGQSLWHYFPHLYRHFKGQDIELNDFLIGKYAYGISTDTIFGKTIIRTLV